MREESIESYIRFGTVLRFLQDAHEGLPIHGDEWIVANLQSFLGGLEELGLTVTFNAATNEGLGELLPELEGKPQQSRLSDEHATELKTSVTAVRKTLVAEASEKKAFVTAPKRWDVDRLLVEPGAIFGGEVFEKLDSQAAFDFGEACRCLAFELPTAAAFHLMRGTEAVLRSFYCHVVRRGRLQKGKRMWGPMVEQLKNRSKPPPSALLDNLDAIRHNFRNPTQHPDASYSIDEAQDLLGLVVPVVNQMVAEISKSSS